MGATGNGDWFSWCRGHMEAQVRQLEQSVGFFKGYLVNYNMVRYLILIGFIMFKVAASGQTQMNGCCDLKVDRKCTLIALHLSQNDWLQASDVLETILESDPQDEQCLIEAIGFYESWLKQQPGERAAQLAQARIVALYDQRLTFSNDSINILNRKAAFAFRHYRQDRTKLPWLMDLFDQCLDVSGPELFKGNFVAYVDVLRRHQLNNDPYTAEEFLQKYYRLLDLFELTLTHYKLTGKPINHLMELKGFVESAPIVDPIEPQRICGSIMKKYEEAFNQRPTDRTIAKRIVALHREYQCQNEALYARALRVVLTEDN